MLLLVGVGQVGHAPKKGHTLHYLLVKLINQQAEANEDLDGDL